jgi:hypothetical protein
MNKLTNPSAQMLAGSERALEVSPGSLDFISVPYPFLNLGCLRAEPSLRNQIDQAVIRSKSGLSICHAKIFLDRNIPIKAYYTLMEWIRPMQSFGFGR